jgi:hypothetical protein
LSISAIKKAKDWLISIWPRNSSCLRSTAHPSLHPAAAAPNGVIDYSHLHGIAMQGRIEIRRADQDILVTAFDDHEPHTGAGDVQSAFEYRREVSVVLLFFFFFLLFIFL